MSHLPNTLGRSNIPQSETDILTSFLLSRSSLQDIATLHQFESLFPRDKRSHPQVKILYRHLQQIRTRQCEKVKRNIATEVQLGVRQRKIAVLMGKRAQVAEMDLNGEGPGDKDEDVETGIELFGPSSSTHTHQLPPLHTLKTFLPVLENATTTLTAEIARIEEECAELQEEMENAVGDLSDLRYGKFAQPGIDRMVIEQLRNLSETCERVLEGKEKREMEKGRLDGG